MHRREERIALRYPLSVRTRDFYHDWNLHLLSHSVKRLESIAYQCSPVRSIHRCDEEEIRPKILVILYPEKYKEVGTRTLQIDADYNPTGS